jgi:hypothetical protein
MHTGGKRGEGAPRVPPIKIFEKLPHKNAIKHDPPDFLTTASTPLKRICQKTPRTLPPPGFPTTMHLCFSSNFYLFFNREATLLHFVKDFSTVAIIKTYSFLSLGYLVTDRSR